MNTNVALSPTKRT